MTTTTMTTTTETTETVTPIDEARVEEFAGRLIGLYTGSMLTLMVDLGHRTGLFTAAAEGAATSAELAARAGLDECYVREWLGAMVTGGVVAYDPGCRTYVLPAERAVCLTGGGAANLAPLAQVATFLGKHVEGVSQAFRDGGRVPYGMFRPESTDVMDAMGRGTFDELLLGAWLPLAPGLTDRLASGARVADVGCGTGHAVVLMAQAFPASTFVGYDLAEDAIARALAPGGTYVMVEPAASSNLEDNIANPIAPFMYTVSTLHCMTVSLAHGGAGLGTVWGEQVARTMLAEIGFGDVAVHPAPGDPLNAIFVTTRPEVAS